MGIFFLPKQKALPLRQRGKHKNFKKVVDFSIFSEYISEQGI